MSKRKSSLFLLFFIPVIISLTSCFTEPVSSIVPTETATLIPLPAETLPPSPTPTPAPYPSPRGYQRMVFDLESNMIFLYGGQPDGKSSHDDCWLYNAESNNWIPIEMDCLNHTSITYHEEGDRIILYTDASGRTMAAMGQLHTFDINNQILEKIKVKGIPYGYLGAEIAYDAESNKVILFGGFNLSNRQLYNKTLAYDLAENYWEELSPENSPSHRNYPAMAYHPGLDRVILFGGDSYRVEGENDTWMYDYNTNSWTKIDTIETPPGRTYTNMVYVPILDKVVMFGGVRYSSGISDFWAFDHENNTWVELNSEPGPGERGWHAMVYAPNIEKVVLFGGGPNKASFDNQTWIYDPLEDSWTNITP